MPKKNVEIFTKKREWRAKSPSLSSVHVLPYRLVI